MTVPQIVGCALLALIMLLSSAASNATTPDRRRHASPQLIVCGMTGCFEVPPGCHYEMRRSGRGVVAVVLCDKK